MTFEGRLPRALAKALAVSRTRGAFHHSHSAPMRTQSEDLASVSSSPREAERCARLDVPIGPKWMTMRWTGFPGPTWFTDTFLTTALAGTLTSSSDRGSVVGCRDGHHGDHHRFVLIAQSADSQRPQCPRGFYVLGRS